MNTNNGKAKRIIGFAALGLGVVAGITVLLKSKRTIPKGATAVTPFDADKYLGKWYEIARLDFRFEKNLKNTEANYSLNPDGSIKVVNRGYDFKKQKWNEATGKAKFAGNPTEAKLKVSFFGPFYAGYNVIALDPDYRYALVAGEDLSYLWLLSRETTMPEPVKTEYLQQAAALGYDTQKLVWVEHDPEHTQAHMH